MNGGAALSESKLINNKIKLSKVDIAALFVTVFFAVYYFIRINYGLTMIDESFYFTIPHRLFFGDELIVDEWHVSQFSSLFHYLPFKLFYDANGTEGIVMYFRHIFVVCFLIFGVYIYIKLRKYRWTGLLSAAVFMVFIPCTCMTINYYTMSLMAIVLTGSILFLNEKQKHVKLIFCGFVFACCVLIEPFCAFIYFGYALYVLIKAFLRKKGKTLSDKYAFIFNLRHLGFLTLGISICAVIFLALIIYTSGVERIIKAIPEFFTDAEYDFSFFGNIADLKPFTDAAKYFGYVPAVLGIIICAVLLVFRKNRKKIKIPVFVISVIALVFAYLYEYIGIQWHIMEGMVLYQPVPMYVFGFICYVLSENKDRKLFAFWMYSAIYSFLLDISSCFAVGICSSAANITGVIFIINFLKELTEEKTEKSKNKKNTPDKYNKFIRAVALVAFASLCLTQAAHLFVMTRCFFLEDGLVNHEGKLEYEIEKGPYKGIKTRKGNMEKINDVMDDLDIIKENTDGPVYVTALFSWCYLYMDRPYSTYSTWYVDDDYKDRMLRWWELHPESLPAYIYIPSCNGAAYYPEPEQQQMELDFVKETFDCTITQGKVGYIAKINAMKTEL